MVVAGAARIGIGFVVVGSGRTGIVVWYDQNSMVVADMSTAQHRIGSDFGWTKRIGLGCMMVVLESTAVGHNAADCIGPAGPSVAADIGFEVVVGRMNLADSSLVVAGIGLSAVRNPAADLVGLAVANRLGHNYRMDRSLRMCCEK